VEDLRPYFEKYGYIMETHTHLDKGFCFLKMDSHDNAAQAIYQLFGTTVNGQRLRISWGKDKDAEQLLQAQQQYYGSLYGSTGGGAAGYANSAGTASATTGTAGYDQSSAAAAYAQYYSQMDPQQAAAYYAQYYAQMDPQQAAAYYAQYAQQYGQQQQQQHQ
jgi:nucleolysin TIA-1/TIAR